MPRPTLLTTTYEIAFNLLLLLIPLLIAIIVVLRAERRYDLHKPKDP